MLDPLEIPWAAAIAAAAARMRSTPRKIDAQIAQYSSSSPGFCAGVCGDRLRHGLFRMVDGVRIAAQAVQMDVIESEHDLQCQRDQRQHRCRAALATNASPSPNAILRPAQ